MRAVFKTKTNQDHTHMLHVWVYLLPKLGDLVGHMLVNIPAPWCTWDMPKKKQGTGFFCLVSSTVAQEMIRIAPITRWMVDPTFEQVMATGVKVSLLMGYVVIHRTVKKIEI
jgi:hypothetical protein